MKTVYMFKTILFSDGKYSAGLKCYQCHKTLTKDNFDTWKIYYENDQEIFKSLKKTVRYSRCPHCGQYLNADNDFDKF